MGRNPTLTVILSAAKDLWPRRSFAALRMTNAVLHCAHAENFLRPACTRDSAGRSDRAHTRAFGNDRERGSLRPDERARAANRVGGHRRRAHADYVDTAATRR